MNRSWHDIVLGDFGRNGTLRYLRAFEVAERHAIVERLGGRPFFDEMRRVRYTVIGALRQIKAEFLPANDTEINHHILVGIHGGLEQALIRRQLLHVLVPYIRNASQNGADIIRIVIPCNSLSETAMWLRKCLGMSHEEEWDDDSSAMLAALQLPPNVHIVVPHLPSIVMEHLNAAGVQDVLLVGTLATLRAYEHTAECLGFRMTIRSWAPPGMGDFCTWLQACTESGCPDTEIVANVYRDEVVVCACTDLRVLGAIDSVEILAEKLVKDAYCNAESD